MTQVDVVYRYGLPPTESAVQAIARMREIYGVRKIEFRELEQTVRVEFDSTRLSEIVIQQLLRRAGLNVQEKLTLYTLPAPADQASAPASVPKP